MTGHTLTPERVEEWRREFPILAGTTYLVNHSLGAMPRAATRALANYAETWATRGVRAWEETWWDLAAEVGDLLAPILGAPPGSVSLHQNVAVALSVALSGLDWEGERRRIVACDLEFPSVLYQFREQERVGAEPVIVSSPDRYFPYEAVLGAIDERTRLVLVSRVVYHSAEVVNPGVIARRCREMGAELWVDAYQAGGILPIDLEAEDVDVAVGGSVKFLLGGPGVGYLYVNPQRAVDLRPRHTGWMAHRRPFAFETDHDLRDEGSWRYLGGTPQVPALYTAREGYRIVNRVGLPAIRERSLRLTKRILDRCRDQGWKTATPHEDSRRGGSVTVALDGGEDLVRSLAAEEILVDARPRAGVRIGPHFFNTEAEVDHGLDRLAALVEHGT